MASSSIYNSLRHRPQWWRRMMNLAPWLLLPGLALIVYALYLGEGDYLTVAASIWQFPMIALGMAALLVCVVSSRLILRGVKISGAAFIARIVYSADLALLLIVYLFTHFALF